MTSLTILKVDTTQSLLCLIPRLIMLDNTYYFLYAPETRIKKHVRVPTPNPRLVPKSLQTGQQQKKNAAKTLYESCLQK